MIKERLEAYLASHTDKFAERYLRLRDPELWVAVKKATTFLTEKAKPKQRCWHILNDTYSIPKCPVDGVDRKWFDNRYLTYSSLSAKARCPESAQNRVNKYRSSRNIDPDARVAYRNDVWRHTKRNWRHHKHEIANYHLRGKGWHLDHKFSINDGYLQNVPAEIVGHWRNFEILPATDNYLKHARSSISLEELVNFSQ